MMTLELALITQPRAAFMPITYLPETVRAWIPEEAFYLLPFQILTIARRASITLHIFISQIAPSSPSNSGSQDKIHPQALVRMAQLVQATRATDIEAMSLQQLSLAPFRGDRDSVNALRQGMKEGLILGGVRSSPEVQRAVAQVIERRKASNENTTK